MVGSRLLLVLVSAIAIAACSAAKLGYLNATWLLVQQVNRNLDLDSDQRDWVQDCLESHIDEEKLREDRDDEDGRRDDDGAIRRIERLTGRLDRSHRAEIGVLFASRAGGRVGG